ncbi:hypothetical protein [uncultured Paludibaculum sp.]|uniref:hypothetical protein n=1 Tax=uncultured Paludibaculum sp. TaxID=1765020 RepID=UPI002AAB1B93|nr:hypothetical protein [uncultured Paludibaculum sp.]
MPMKNGRHEPPAAYGPAEREFDEHIVDHLKEFSSLTKQLRSGISGAAKGEAMNKYNALHKRLLDHAGSSSDAD